MIYDVLIIGAGPGGLTAGLYSARAKMKTVILEKGIYGGNLQNTTEIENYPSYKNVSGQQLAEDLYQQVIEHDVEYKYGDVESISQLDNGYWKVVSDMEEIIAKSVIISTGTKNNPLGVEGEEDYLGMGVSYCATCDGSFFENKDILVVGGGDSAVEEAELLTNFGKNVTLIHRRDSFRAMPSNVEKLKRKENIEILMNTELQLIKGEQNVTHVHLISDNEEQIRKMDGVFIYVGMSPNTSFINLDILDEEGFIITDNKMRTKYKNLYAIGDVRQDNNRQIITAMSDGSIASLDIYKNITE